MDTIFDRKKIPPASINPTLAAKWGTEVLDEGYIPFPKRLLRCLDAIFGQSNGINELQVALVIADYLRPNLTRGPSVDFLAFTTGIKRGPLKRLLRTMKARGLIDCKGSEEELRVSNDGLRQRILEATKDKTRPKAKDEDVIF